MKKKASARSNAGVVPGSREYEILNKIPTKRRRRTKITPKALIKAIKGSGGNRTEIARRLMVRRFAVAFCIDKKFGPEWDQVRKAYQDELDGAADEAEKTVRFLVKQRKDLTEAGKNSRWLLEKRRRETYGDSKTITLEGGKNPLQVQQNTVSMDVLDKLPIEVRRKLLAEIEKAQAQADNKDAKKGD